MTLLRLTWAILNLIWELRNSPTLKLKRNWNYHLTPT